MIYQFLCIALVACSLVQAAPQNNLFSQGANELLGHFDKVGKAGREIIAENVHQVNEAIKSGVNAGQGFLDAGRKTLHTGIKLGLTFPRFGVKVLEKFAQNEESTSQ